MTIQHVPRDNEGNNRYDGSGKKLPRPQVALQKEGNGREHTSYDAADHLGTVSHDDTSKKAPHAHQEAGQCKEALAMHAGKACD